MARSSGRRDLERCTFCTKSRQMVDSLIAGPPGVYICNECIELCNTILLEERRREREGAAPAAESAFSLQNLPAPAELKGQLDAYVIGQDEAKKYIAVAVYNHYKRILLPPATGEDVEIEKSNILLVGPTGSGKTLIARTVARIINVPFAIGDATTLTEAGYVGEDVENILLKLLQAAEGDVERAQRGIVFIDEVDKIGRTTGNVSITRDVSGEGVQQALLKILEGTVANIPPQGGRKHPEQAYIPLNTEHILFLCGGAFIGLEDLIAQRVGRQHIGFNAAQIAQGDQGYIDLLRQVQPEDFIKFGLIPEFIGRLPVVAALAPLTEEDLIRVLTQPKNALVRQYQKLFELEGAELRFESDALRTIARLALERETGARGLRSIIERFMLDLMFELPSHEHHEAYVVTEAVVRGGQRFWDPKAMVSKPAGRAAKGPRPVARETDTDNQAKRA